jgi:exonuclease VII small subunit
MENKEEINKGTVEDLSYEEAMAELKSITESFGIEKVSATDSFLARLTKTLDTVDTEKEKELLERAKLLQDHCQKILSEEKNDVIKRGVVSHFLSKDLEFSKENIDLIIGDIIEETGFTRDDIMKVVDSIEDDEFDLFDIDEFIDEEDEGKE